MWLMTIYGFFSIVRSRYKGDSNLVVRARKREHLENLIAAYPDWLQGSRIQSTTGTDYPCRIVVPRERMMRVVGNLLLHLEHMNFKDEVKHQLPKDDDYQTFLLTVWAQGRRMTPYVEDQTLRNAKRPRRQYPRTRASRNRQ